ncbi:amidase [uncultured Amnibacterium sp.]|uniref:amidase n=1 Tax=uncultured Amnibacterium sp. TaxID=1631851 RepID=UPI0035C9BE76
MAFEPHQLTAQEQWDWIRRGDATSAELTASYLRRIERLDGCLGAYSRVDGDRAMARAAAIDAAGQGAAPLSGVPVAEKELVRRAGTAWGASRLFAGAAVEASDDVALATDATGAVVLGATTAPEFGLTGFSEPAGRPPARNPWDPATGAGGSSGGAAAAVAAGLAPFAIGSDGGGSIRIPAAWCGVVGLKPSRGRVPALGGQGAFAGLVTAGPIARTVADAAMLLDALVRPEGRARSAGYATVPGDDGEPLLGDAVRGEGRFSLGVLEGSVWDDALDVTVDPDNAAAVARAVAELDGLGHGVESVRLPGEDYPAFFRVLWQAGAAPIPARTAAELALLEPYTREIVERGRRLPAEQVVTAVLAAAAFERRAIAAFARFDAVVTPTTALPPRPLGWYAAAGDDADSVFDRQVQAAPFTSFVNVSGLPAITLPVGSSAEGAPAGVQLIGRPGGERALLAIGRQLERRLGWSRRHPPAFW